MQNNELIKALRNCADYSDCGICKLNGKFNCADMMMRDAADALEELQQIADHYEQTAKDYWEEACEYKQRIAELEAQLPKEGEWIDEQRGRWIYAKCNLCGKVQDVRSNYCPNCGARMKGERNEQIH